MKRIVLFLFLIAIVPIGLVAAQGSSPNFVKQRSVVVSSATASSTNFHVRGTFGQPATSQLTSGSFRLSNGFYFAGGQGTPTAVKLLGESAEINVTPFWLLTTLALTLFCLSLWLRRRSR